MQPEAQSHAAQPRRVLVLQGGGALGSYQAGVYEALREGELDPSWIAGISIGAVNAAIIAGNPPEKRVERLREFWELVTSGWTPSPLPMMEQARAAISDASAGWAVAGGVPGFFSPRLLRPWLPATQDPGALSFYDTTPLRETLERLVDFDRINAKETRLSVGAVHIKTGNFAYFDNLHQKIGPEHIMASGALPPGLPPIEIEGEWYWDGGLVSNTPLEYVLDTGADEDLMIFQVDLFNARGPVPVTLGEAAEREKDIRYSSRTRLNTDANLRIHRLKAALRDLLANLPEPMASDPSVGLLKDLSKEHAVTVIQLIYRAKPYEGGFKDFEFSRHTMLDHWSSGVADASRCRRKLDRYAHRPQANATAVFDPGREAVEQGEP